METAHRMVMKTKRGGPHSLYHAVCSADGCRWKSHVAFATEAESMAIIRKRWSEHQGDLARKQARAAQVAQRSSDSPQDVGPGATFLGGVFIMGVMGLVIWGMTALFGGGEDATPTGKPIEYDWVECNALAGFMKRDDLLPSEQADAIAEYQTFCSQYD